MRIILTILFVSIYLLSIGQTGNGSSDCDRMLKEANAFSNGGKYESAIKKLNAVNVHCPQLSDTVTKRLLKIYTDINQAKQNEEKAKEIAQAEKEKAVTQARISRAARFAAEAERNLVLYPASMVESANNAISSMQLDPGINGDRALRKILDIIAPLKNSVFVDVNPEHVFNNGGWLAIGGFHAKTLNDALAIIDLNTRKNVKFIKYDHTIDDMVITNDGKWIVVAMHEMSGPSYKVEMINTADWNSTIIGQGPGYFGKMTISNQYNCLIYYVPGSPIHIYDMISKKQQDLPVRLPIDMMDIKQMELTKNDQYLAIRSDNAIAVWEDWKLNDPKLVFRKAFSRDEYTNFYEIPFSFSADGSHMAIATKDSLNIFSLPSFKLKKVNYVPEIRSVQFYAVGNNLVTFSNNGNFNNWDSTGRNIGNINVGSNSLLDNRIIPAENFKYTITVRRDDAKVVNGISFWDMRSGKETARLYHDSYISAVYPLHKGTAAVTIGSDQEVRFWDDINEEEIAFGSKRQITGFTLNETSTNLAIIVGDEISVINPGNNSMIRRIKNSTSIRQVRFSSNNKDILMLTGRGLEVWKNRESTMAEHQVLYEIPQSERPGSNAMGFNKKGDVAAICNGNGKITVLYGPSWKPVKTLSYYNPVSPTGLDPGRSELCLSLSGKYIAVGLSEGIAVIDVKNNRQVRFIKQDYHVNKIVFTPDEKRIVFVSGIQPKEDHKNPGWELVCMDIANTGKRSHISFGDVYIGAIDVSSDAKMLAIAIGKRIRIYTFPNKKTDQFELVSEIERDQTVGICEFTERGRYLVSCFNSLLSNEDRVLFSLLKPADLINAVERRLGKLQKK